MVHAQQNDKEKLKEMEGENKRAKTGNFNFSQQMSYGMNRSQFHQKSSGLTPLYFSDLVLNFRQDTHERAPGSKS